MIRRKRKLFFFFLLAIVFLYAIIMCGISLISSARTVKFSRLIEAKKNSQALTGSHTEPQAFNSFSHETRRRKNDLSPAEKRTKIEFMKNPRHRDINFSGKVNREDRLISARIVHHEGESASVTQKAISGHMNLTLEENNITAEGKSSRFEEMFIHKSQIAIENVDTRRGVDGTNSSYCHLPFKYGEMCPKSYTQLGGVCRMLENSTLYCPDIRFKAYNSHRQGQLVTTRMLKIFDLVCKKYNISYWLTGGTLLGAARHKGNIPWDTDNDVEMPLQDYIKFFKTASKDLPADVFFQNSISDPALRPTNYKEALLKHGHKDVGIYRRSWNPRLRDPNSCYKYCILNGCSWHDGMMIDIFIRESQDPNIFPLKQMEFEGLLLPVPKNWRSQLEELYHSNFMKVPEKEKNRMPVDFPDAEHSCAEVESRESHLAKVLRILQTKIRVLWPF